MSSRLDIPTLEADFEAVVDSIRAAGTITNTVSGGGKTTLTTENNLSVDQVIIIDDFTECRIIEASETELVVNKELASATTWKAAHPYFMHGHLNEISNRLAEKDNSGDSVIKYTKYPLIVLLQDLDYSMNPVESNKTAINFLIVNSTKPTYITDERLEYNFTPIIDPIYNNLINAINIGTNKIKMLNDDFSLKRWFYWGSDIADQNPFGDRLDAIEVRNLNLKLTPKNCT